MSEAKAEAIKSRVVCDEPGCGWFEKCDFADVPKWHKKPCPKCGKGEIVSDEEMVVFGLAEAAVKITNYIDPDGKMKRRNYHLNTAPMRAANAEVEWQDEAGKWTKRNDTSLARWEYHDKSGTHLLTLVYEGYTDCTDWNGPARDFAWVVYDERDHRGRHRWAFRTRHGEDIPAMQRFGEALLANAKVDAPSGARSAE